jgi:hypothetical protein
MLRNQNAGGGAGGDRKKSEKGNKTERESTGRIKKEGKCRNKR